MLFHYLLHETTPCLDGIGVRSFVSGLCSAQCVCWQFHCSENIVKCVYTLGDYRDITRRWITVEYHHVGALPWTEKCETGHDCTTASTGNLANVVMFQGC